MNVSVILVNYNGLSYNDTCIASVLASDWEGALHIYVVDNGSTDGSMEALEEKYGNHPALSFQYMGENLGFSAANNAGIRQALRDGTEDILLLNNDTVIEKTMLRELWRVREKYGNCIVVPKIYFYDRPQVIWSAGGGLSRVVKKPFAYGENQEDSALYDVEKKCASGNGCCLFLSREVLERIGYLDESFFLYYEDTEFFMRAGERGVDIIYAPAARMYHKVNGSTRGNENPACVYYISRNWMMCHKKHLSRGNYVIYWIYFMLNRGAWVVIWLLQGKRKQVKAVFEGIGDFYRGRMGKCLE